MLRELDIVQQSKEKFIQKEPEDKIREFIKSLLDIPVKVGTLSMTTSLKTSIIVHIYEFLLVS